MTTVKLKIVTAPASCKEDLKAIESRFFTLEEETDIGLLSKYYSVWKNLLIAQYFHAKNIDFCKANYTTHFEDANKTAKSHFLNKSEKRFGIFGEELYLKSFVSINGDEFEHEDRIDSILLEGIDLFVGVLSSLFSRSREEILLEFVKQL